MTTTELVLQTVPPLLIVLDKYVSLSRSWNWNVPPKGYRPRSRTLSKQSVLSMSFHHRTRIYRNFSMYLLCCGTISFIAFAIVSLFHDTVPVALPSAFLETRSTPGSIGTNVSIITSLFSTTLIFIARLIQKNSS